MAHPNANRTLQALLPDWQRQLQIWAAAQEALLLQEEPRALHQLAKRQEGSIFY